MATVLLTGANRGIGLEFVKQYLEAGWQVLACCRDPEQANALQALGDHSSLSIHQLDVADAQSIQALASELANQPIDILLNNAGIYATGANHFGEVDTGIWIRAIQTNTIAPLLMAQAFIHNIEQGERKLIATLSSKVGSIDDNQSGGGYAYRSSKSAVNQVMKSLSIDLAPRGINTVSLHPGWVQTDMGGPNALINTKESVTGMMSVLDNLSNDLSGSFINYDGSIIPW